MYSPQITDASKKYGNNRWLAYSPKLGRTVFLFSDLEYEHWLQIEFNSKIKKFCEQPLKIEVTYNKTLATSIFDMWIQYYDDSEEFIEIKYTADLSKDRVIKQINIQKAWCKDNNKNHKVMTELEIRQSPVKMSNLKIMIKKLNTNLDKPAQIDLVKQLLLKGRSTITDLANNAQIPLEDTLTIVIYLIYTNEINSNYLDKPFGKYTEVWI